MRKILFTLSLLAIATAGLADRAHATDDNQPADDGGVKRRKASITVEGNPACLFEGTDCIVT